MPGWRQARRPEHGPMYLMENRYVTGTVLTVDGGSTLT